MSVYILRRPFIPHGVNGPLQAARESSYSTDFIRGKKPKVHMEYHSQTGCKLVNQVSHRRYRSLHCFLLPPWVDMCPEVVAAEPSQNFTVVGGFNCQHVMP
jgi:hypothetical protein